MITHLRDIGYGHTASYAEVAVAAGNPKAVRAVGSVCSHNPIPVVVPCHRVVRSDGEPGGYLFGPAAKEMLLAGEDIDLAETRDLAAGGVHFIASDTTGVVCYPTCHDARRITPAHRVGFRTLELALAAGFRTCRHCRPAVAQPA